MYLTCFYGCAISKQSFITNLMLIA